MEGVAWVQIDRTLDGLIPLTITTYYLIGWIIENNGIRFEKGDFHQAW